MNHQTLLEQEKQNAREAQRQAQRAKTLYQIFKKHPEIVNCQANESAIDGWFGDSLTTEAFEHDFNASAEFRNKLALQTLEQAQERAEKTKAHIIEEIVSLSCVSPESAPHFRKNLFYSSVEELQLRLQQIQEKQQLQQLPKEQLREIVREQNPRAVVEQPKKFLPLEYDAATIKRLSLKELKGLQKKFGADAITARLNGWDLQEQEQYLKSGFGGI